MGRVYSGNLYALGAAENRVKSLGLTVEEERWRNPSKFRDEYALRIKTESGAVIAAKVFSHYDEDVTCNEMTAWLNRCYEDLKDWS